MARIRKVAFIETPILLPYNCYNEFVGNGMGIPRKDLNLRASC